MKKLNYVIVFTLFCLVQNDVLFAAACPPNGRHRGMYVDCVREMFDDIIINQDYTIRDNLLSYISSHCIDYIALYDLDDGVIIGDPLYETQLSNFITLARAGNTSLTVGAISTSKTFFDNFNIGYFKTGQVSLICHPDIERRINEACNPSAESLRTFPGIAKANAARYAYNVSINYNFTYAGQIDVLSLEHEYWSSTFVSELIYHQPGHALTTADFDAAFENHLEIMDYMELIRCGNQKLILESEVSLRSSLITKSKLQQAIDIDRRYFNRLLLVDYYKDPLLLADAQCERLQLFGDSHTDRYTVIWPLFSAEGDNIPDVDCYRVQGTVTSINPFLGDVLYPQTTSLADYETAHHNVYTTAMTSGNTGSNCPSNWSGGDNIIDGYMWFSSKYLVGYNVLPRLGRGFDNNSSVRYYPNPSSGKFTLENISNDNLDIEIYNLTGQLVYQKNVPSQKVEIDISNMPKGIYNISVINKKDNILRGKLILD